MKKILALSILVIATLVIRAQSKIGTGLTSKENIVIYLIEQEKLACSKRNVLIEENFYCLLIKIY